MCSRPCMKTSICSFVLVVLVLVSLDFGFASDLEYNCRPSFSSSFLDSQFSLTKFFFTLLTLIYSFMLFRIKSCFSKNRIKNNLTAIFFSFEKFRKNTTSFFIFQRCCLIYILRLFCIYFKHLFFPLISATELCLSHEGYFKLISNN